MMVMTGYKAGKGVDGVDHRGGVVVGQVGEHAVGQAGDDVVAICAARGRQVHQLSQVEGHRLRHVGDACNHMHSLVTILTCCRDCAETFI